MSAASDVRRLGREARGIYWDEPWGLVDGCTPVSEACLHCWAAERVHRFSFQERYQGLTELRAGIPTFTGKIRLVHEALEKPHRRRIPTIYAIWTDLFHACVPMGFIATAFEVIKATPHHTYICCTKRPGRMADWFSLFEPAQFPNVIPMTTAEDQEQADLRLPELLRIKGYRLGVSIEPGLGPVDVRPWLPRVACDGCGSERVGLGQVHEILNHPDDRFPERCGEGVEVRGLSWVIAGAETGHGARPMEVTWARSLRDQCVEAGAAFWLKKLSDGTRLLDEAEWSERP